MRPVGPLGIAAMTYKVKIPQPDKKPRDLRLLGLLAGVVLVLITLLMMR